MTFKLRIITCTLFLAGLIFTLAPRTHAEDVRHGVVTAMSPIQNRGDDETATTKAKRKLGSSAAAVGGLFAMGKTHSTTVGTASTAAAPAAGEAATKVGSQGPAAHYMVQIKMDKGKVVSLVMAADKVKGITTGSKVRVTGDGDSATLQAE